MGEHLSLPKCSTEDRNFQEPMTCTHLIFHFEADSLNTKATRDYKLLNFPKIPYSVGLWLYSLVQQRNGLLKVIQYPKDLMNFPNSLLPDKNSSALKHQSDSMTLIFVCVCSVIFACIML